MTDEQVVSVAKLLALSEVKYNDFIYKHQRHPTHWLISEYNYNLLMMAASATIYSFKLEGADFSVFRGLKVCVCNGAKDGIAPCLM